MSQPYQARQASRIGGITQAPFFLAGYFCPFVRPARASTPPPRMLGRRMDNEPYGGRTQCDGAHPPGRGRRRRGGRSIVRDHVSGASPARGHGCAPVDATRCSTPPHWCTTPICGLPGRPYSGCRIALFHAVGRAGDAIGHRGLARRRRALRRGGDQKKVTLTTGIVDVASGEAEILRVHNALEEMARATSAWPASWRCSISRA